MDLTEKILFYMKRYHMIPQNKNIVVGLSGGADSVCLLYVLVALRKKLGLQLCAVHVHHGLRGVEADADEAYVRDICRAWDVPLKAIRIEAAALAKQWGPFPFAQFPILRRERPRKVCFLSYRR